MHFEWLLSPAVNELLLVAKLVQFYGKVQVFTIGEPKLNNMP